MESDKADKWFHWEERRDLRRMDPVDGSKYRFGVLRQNVVRGSMESYLEGGNHVPVTSAFAKKNVMKRHQQFLNTVARTPVGLVSTPSMSVSSSPSLVSQVSSLTAGGRRGVSSGK